MIHMHAFNSSYILLCLRKELKWVSWIWQAVTKKADDIEIESIYPNCEIIQTMRN